MKLVSLTSDYGNSEYYIAALKGKIIGALGEVQLVDVTHEVPRDDLGVAAYQLKACINSFPFDSVHLCCVNEFLYARSGLVICKEREQWFILPNNGLMYLLFQEPVQKVIVLSAPDDFEGRQNFIVQCIAQLFENPDELHSDENIEVLQKFPLQPIRSQDIIRAKVLHIDHYGNIILNISADLFHEVVGTKDFGLEFRRYNYSNGLHSSFENVDIGEIVCYFSPSGYLVVCAFQDKADELLDVKVNETVNLVY